ncbi:MAG: hypothetical protein IK066_09405, partial [Kiritimatiellae bacterium]|nr:hypothetical protein [Kiritimatiellia bacterium]
EEARLRGAVEAASAESAEAEKRLEGARTARRNAEEEASRARAAAESEKRACGEAEAAFAARLAAAGFAGEAEWTAACLEESEHRRLAKACEDFRAEEERLRGRRELLDARKAAHEGAEGRPAEGRTEDAVRADLAGAAEARRAAEASAVKARKEIEDQADERRRCAAAEAAWKAQEARAKKWEWLDRRVGGENGANFRRYAQGRNLRVLLDAATPRLEAMSGGDYRFEWDAGSDSLEPLVRDRHYEKARPVSNLSGGESFFASLALALSFANFNARQAPIGTLFLDEGFGTLDAVSLDRALDVLAGLGAESGRQVGLVTHVEQVKERVAVHIDVEKRGDGRSVLRGPGVRRLSADGAGKGKKAKGDGV